MISVELIHLDCVASQVSDKPEVSPMRKELGLVADETSAPDDQPLALVVALGDLSLSVRGVLDRGPGRLADLKDGLEHGFHHLDAHRVADIQALEGCDGGVR